MDDNDYTDSRAISIWELPPDFPALQLIIKNGESSFKQRLLPGCQSKKIRQESISLL